MAMAPTVTVLSREIASSGRRRHFVRINLAAGTYDTGVALTPANLGFAREIAALTLHDAVPGGRVWRWDHVNRTLRAYEVTYDPTLTVRTDEALAELDAADNPGATTLHAIAEGS